MAAFFTRSRYKYLSKFAHFSRENARYSTSVSTNGGRRAQAVEKLNLFMKWYENVIGLSEVRCAQNNVIEVRQKQTQKCIKKLFA